MKDNVRAYIWGSIFLMLFMLCNKNTYVNVQVYKFKDSHHDKKDKCKNDNSEKNKLESK